MSSTLKNLLDTPADICHDAGVYDQLLLTTQQPIGDLPKVIHSRSVFFCADKQAMHVEFGNPVGDENQSTDSGAIRRGPTVPQRLPKSAFPSTMRVFPGNGQVIDPAHGTTSRSKWYETAKKLSGLRPRAMVKASHRKA